LPEPGDPGNVYLKFILGHAHLLVEDIMQLLSDNPALRSNLESQAAFIHAFSQMALDTLRQVSEANLKLARQEIEGTLHAGREMMGCTDPLQLMQAVMRQVPPATERLRAYQQHLLAVLAGAQAGLVHAAGGEAGAVAADMARHAAAASAPVTGPGPGNGNGNGSHTHH
jgi:hypothetical protein